MALFVAPGKESFTTAIVGTTQDSNGVTKTYSIQVVGVGAVPTSWSVNFEVSLDGTNFDTIMTHNTAVGNGKIYFSGNQTYPARFFRANVTQLTLGSATSLTVILLACK